MRLVTLLILLAPAAAPAQSRSIPWITDFYRAREEAKDRGAPILLCIGGDGDQAPERMYEGAWRSDGLADLMGGAVCVLAWKGSPHSLALLKGAKPGDRNAPGGCPRFPIATVTCKGHDDVYREVYPRFVKREVYLPLHIFLDHEGKELFRKEGDMPVEAFRKFLVESFARTGKGLSIARYKELRADFEQAERAAEGKSYGRAIALYRKVAGVKAGIADRAKAALADLDEIGEQEVERARGLAGSGRRKEAEAALSSVLQRFAGLPCAAEARKALKEVQSGP
jgi:hypothetical protein